MQLRRCSWRPGARSGSAAVLSPEACGSKDSRLSSSRAGGNGPPRRSAIARRSLTKAVDCEGGITGERRLNYVIERGPTSDSLDLILRLEKGEVEQDGGAEQVGAVEGVGLRGEDHLRCKHTRKVNVQASCAQSGARARGRSPGSCRRRCSTPS